MTKGEKVMRRWFEEVWNKGRVELIDEMLAEDFHTRGLRDSKVSALGSAEAIKAFRKHFAEEFPELHIDVEDVVTEGDRVALRCHVRVTHAGTGKQAEFGGMCFAHLKDGKISQAWNNFDFAHMRQQLA